MLLKSIFAQKSKKYMLIFLGKFPENFKHGIKPLIDNDHKIKFTFGPASLILIFNSKQPLKELNNTLNKVYGEYCDAFFLHEITNNNYGRFCIDVINKNLYEGVDDKLTNDEKLNKIHQYIYLMFRMYEEMAKEILKQTQEFSHINENEITDINTDNILEIDMDQIDNIIDKIKEVGFDNLTEEEKITYTKIFKK
jgi:hypothetical protein